MRTHAQSSLHFFAELSIDMDPQTLHQTQNLIFPLFFHFVSRKGTVYLRFSNLIWDTRSDQRIFVSLLGAAGDTMPPREPWEIPKHTHVRRLSRRSSKESGQFTDLALKGGSGCPCLTIIRKQVTTINYFRIFVWFVR